MDKNGICAGYWESRPYSRSLAQIEQHPQPNEQPGRAGSVDRISSVEADALLKGLLKKADTLELHALHSLLKTNSPTIDQSSLITLLNEEMSSRPSPG